jgi:hypothetical protein
MNIEFYKLTSQIIPVLLVGITLQSQFISRGEKYLNNENFIKNIHIKVFLFIVVLLCIGEFVSLKNVYLNKANKDDLFVVIISLVAGVLWIVADYVLALKWESKEIFNIGFLIVGIVGLILELYFLFIKR